MSKSTSCLQVILTLHSLRSKTGNAVFGESGWLANKMSTLNLQVCDGWLISSPMLCLGCFHNVFALDLQKAANQKLWNSLQHFNAEGFPPVDKEEVMCHKGLASKLAS
jgi:hypothetical protein